MSVNSWKLSVTRHSSTPMRAPLLTPANLAQLSKSEIAEIPVYGPWGNSTIGNWFEIESISTPADAATNHGPTLEIHGDCSHLTYIGLGMTGGTISIYGQIGDYCASGMRGGTLIVHGDSGDFFASAGPHSNRGMRGGEAIITGSTGDRLGYRLRRGTILVGGKAGMEGCAEMIAGTVVVLGEISRNWLINAKRGSLIIPDTSRMETEASMSPTDSFELSFLPILWNRIRAVCTQHRLDLQIPEAKWVKKRVADRAVNGRAELLLLKTNSATNA